VAGASAAPIRVGMAGVRLMPAAPDSGGFAYRREMIDLSHIEQARSAGL